LGQGTAPINQGADGIIISETDGHVELAPLTLEQINGIINPPFPADLIGPALPRWRTVDLPGVDSPTALPEVVFGGPIHGLMLDVGGGADDEYDGSSLSSITPITQTTQRVNPQEERIGDQGVLRSLVFAVRSSAYAI